MRPSLAQSIFSMRCPRCREGRLYPYATYSTRFLTTHRNCPCCGQPFLLEPGFFLGSAYFSYAINGVLLLIFGLTLFYAGEQITVGWMVVAFVVVVVGLLPFTLRLSKALWIHLFVRYEGACQDIPKKD
jgi:uncharacterized protein (DUF983 family)